MPRCRAVSAIESEPSTTIFTASSRYSAVNFRYFPIRPPRSGSHHGFNGSCPSGATHLTGEGEDLGVVDEAVDHGGGDDLVAEALAPASERQVRGDHDRGLF